MIRKIIKIDREKCNGCGLCASACHEGAIELVGGKAALTRENYCDGLGDCLPACPTGAITFEEREAPAYDESAVLASKAKKTAEDSISGAAAPSQLRQWPVQIKLVPVTAPWLDGADVLIAADCTAYAYGNFHQDFIRNRVTLVGCPKLDGMDYSEKIAAIFAANAIVGITLTRMLVPCCGGLEVAVKKAIAASGKRIPLRIVTISPDGEIVNERTVFY